MSIETPSEPGHFEKRSRQVSNHLPTCSNLHVHAILITSGCSAPKMSRPIKTSIMSNSHFIWKPSVGCLTATRVSRWSGCWAVSWLVFLLGFVRSVTSEERMAAFFKKLEDVTNQHDVNGSMNSNALTLNQSLLWSCGLDVLATAVGINHELLAYSIGCRAASAK